MVRTLASRASTTNKLAQEFDITRRQACHDLQRIEGEGHPLTHMHASGRKGLAIRHPDRLDGENDPRIGGQNSGVADRHYSGPVDRGEALGRNRHVDWIITPLAGFGKTFSRAEFRWPPRQDELYPEPGPFNSLNFSLMEWSSLPSTARINDPSKLARCSSPFFHRARSAS